MEPAPSLHSALGGSHSDPVPRQQQIIIGLASPVFDVMGLLAGSSHPQLGDSDMSFHSFMRSTWSAFSGASSFTLLYRLDGKVLLNFLQTSHGEGIPAIGIIEASTPRPPGLSETILPPSFSG